MSAGTTENFEKNIWIENNMLENKGGHRINIKKITWISLDDYRHLMNENKYLILYLNNEREKNLESKVLFINYIKFYNDSISFSFQRTLLKIRMYGYSFNYGFRLAGKLSEARNYMLYVYLAHL